VSRRVSPALELIAMRSCLRALALAVSVVLCLGTLAGPAAAHRHTVTEREPILSSLVHEKFSIRLSDGNTARGNVTRFDQADRWLRLRSVLAHDRVAGLETITAMASRTFRQGALAGTNGGFWLPRPTGAPNGYAVQDGVLVGAQAQTVNGYRRTRGAVAVMPDGQMLIDRLNTQLEFRRADGVTVEVDEVNLQPRLSGDNPAPGELIAYDVLFGTPIAVPAGSIVIVVDGIRVPSGGRVNGTVRTVTPAPGATTVTVAEGTTVLLAHGTAREKVTGVAPGHTVSVRTVPRPQGTAAADWGTALSAVPAGPLLIRAGQTASYDQWRAEAFADSHLRNRHPRTAIGLTAGGEVLMVTVDGRRQGHSVGMTMSELTSLMQGLGAREALALDGGGSTTMTVEGAVRNVPSETGRSAANGVFVYHSYPFAASTRVAGRDRFATAANAARVSHPNGALEVVIATGAAFPDALAGGPLATALNAPLLLTGRTQLPEATVEALRELNTSSAVILGGTAAVGTEVARDLEARGIRVRRIAGSNRAATAAAIAGSMVGPDSPELDRVFIASGAGFADALSAAAPAGFGGAPILLGEAGGLPEATRTFLEGRRVGEAVIVGGTSVLSRAVEDELRRLVPEVRITRLAGENRFGTARAVNRWAGAEIEGLDDRGLVVANGSNFPDALAGGPLAAGRGQLLMIVPPRNVRADSEAAAYLDERGQGPLERVMLMGGRAVLSTYQHWQLDMIAAQ
jgi:putative cell wall-binding protein